MMKNTINEFLAEKNIAIAGVSRNSMKWGNGLMKELVKKGIKVYPVNPHADTLEGEKCYHHIAELPEEVKSLIIATKAKYTEAILKEVNNSGIKRVWMQKGAGKGSASAEAVSYCKQNNIPYVYGFCPMMFFGTGMHKFHFWMRTHLGKVPSEFKISLS